MVLFKFWLRRFIIVFAIACTALALLELLRHGDNPSYLSAFGWAGAGALVKQRKRPCAPSSLRGLRPFESSP